MTQDQHFENLLMAAFDEGMEQGTGCEVSQTGFRPTFRQNFISLPVDAFGSDSNTVFRLAVFESLSLGNSKDVGLAEVCFEFHPSISVGYVMDVLTTWGSVFTSDLIVKAVDTVGQDGLFNQYEMSETLPSEDGMDILADYKKDNVEIIRHVVGVDLWKYAGNVRANMNMFKFIYPYVDGVVVDDNEVYLSAEIDWSATSRCYNDGNNAHYLQLTGQGYIGTNTIRGVIVRIPYTFRWMIESWSDYLTEVAKSMGETEWLEHLNSVIGESKPVKLSCQGYCGKCSPAEVHECHLKRNAKN